MLMRVYEYGEGNKRTLLMFQCTAEPTWVFERPARCLARDFHVFLAGADGHDPTEDTTFTTVEDYATKAVAYLQQRGVTRLDALYGVSMGGAAALWLLASKLIPVSRAIIDAGITPYPYPRWVCRVISWRDFCLIPLASLSLSTLKRVSPPEEWTQEGDDPNDEYERIYDFLKHHFSARTNYNVFWSANNYRMPSPVPHVDTQIEYWYGSGEARARRSDIAYVRKAFPQVVVREQEGYEHAQLVLVHPQEFARRALPFLEGADRPA